MLGSWSFYVYGCAAYSDVFKRPHWVTYCSAWDDKSKNYAPCERYNETGDDLTPETASHN